MVGRRMADGAPRRPGVRSVPACRLPASRPRGSRMRLIIDHGRGEARGDRMGLPASPDAVGAGEDGFDWFCETVSSTVMPVTLSTRNPADFRASMTDLDLGVVRLSAVACSPVLSRRTSTHVRRDDPERLHLGLVTRGEVRISQHGNESVVAGESCSQTPHDRARGCAQRSGSRRWSCRSPVRRWD
nr:hypothetical protein [Streptomyces viridochromogenes]